MQAARNKEQGTKFADLQFCALSLYCTPMKQVFKIGSSEELNSSQAVLLMEIGEAYCVPSAIHGLLERTFATGNFWHIYSIILKNGIQKNESGRLIVDFKTDSFCAVATKGDSLLLAQIFSYTRSGDVLYWLLKICEQLSLSQAEVNVILSGLIDTQSAVFKELYQYFLN